MKQLLKQTLKMSIFILLISLLGCNNDDPNFPQVNSGFTYTLNEDSGTVTFINISENSRSYEWNFGDGSTSTEINPVKTYANGTYTVTLKAINVSGAVANFEDIITINIPNPIVLPITFDDPNVAYKAATFNGASFNIVENPAVFGTNDKATKVGAITNSGAQYEGLNFDLGTQIDFSTLKTITMNFWADAPVAVLMKLEQGTGPDVEVTANHGGTGWEMISFNFNSSNKYVRLTLFVDGPGTKAGTFYLDDITQIETPPAPCTETVLQLPIDFESCLDYESKRVAGGIDFSIVDNPQLNGANAVASKVGKIVNKGDNWENLNFKLDTPINFSTNKTIKVKLYSTVSAPIKLKLETGGTPVEKDKTHSGTGWEELTFDFTTSESFSNIIIFIDGPGNTAGTFYVDDIKQVASTPPPSTCTDTTLALPINFDCGSLNYESKRVAGGIDFSIIDNPQLNGANAVASKVGKIVNKGDNWENLNFKLDTPINFSTNKSIKLKLYSTVNVPIKLKVETGGTPVENDQNHSGTGWEELTFTLATSESFSNIIIFIDGPGNTAGTFYIDDITQVASTGGGGGNTSGFNITLPIDFETSGYGAAWTWNVFENGANDPLQFVTNPNKSGINTSDKVAKITALQAGQPWVGTETAHGTMGITWDLSASNAFIKIMVYKTVISDVGIKLANPAGGAQAEIKVANTKINQWEELTFDFSGRIGNGLDGSTNIDQIIVFPDFNLGGRTTDNVVYFDNIRFTSN